ncbi:hypothetical protein BDP81DRAFT_479734 [Colletotrichum phormii]|uniref:Diadenosine 5',5'''-P1,P4-tetraphosphate phosphorylase 2 n=1 Tax=Colletotrichum phormii TaxID=359342 RepID=A0AAJ0EJ18_9PEZI|nr:uncharacterized protein BDP81DRAFT_479734 [Colletotrichum phormii]KAK1638591.1 hypothetical protein BDP81DRAFT_479734 [Colletotrichum phormii]
MVATKVTLPEDLGSKSFVMFDDLVSRGKLFYSESQSEIVSHNGFEFEFRISPALKRKPYLERDDPKRTTEKGPFLHPDPEFVAAQPQTRDLNLGDVEAARAVMAALKPTLGPQLMIYNCGVDAGSSQGHKHVQIFPQPPRLLLYPQRATSDSDKRSIDSRIPGVPNQHFVLRLTQGVTPEQTYRSLQRLVCATRETQTTGGRGYDYNVIMAEDWICVVPRRLVGRDGVGANGAGMVGLVWLRDQAERDGWDSFGLTDHLVQLGLPRG